MSTSMAACSICRQHPLCLVVRGWLNLTPPCVYCLRCVCVCVYVCLCARVRLAWVGQWTHFLLYLLKAGVCTLDDTNNVFGLASVAAFTLTSLLSLNIVRRRFFELFRATHWLFIPG